MIWLNVGALGILIDTKVFVFHFGHMPDFQRKGVSFVGLVSFKRSIFVALDVRIGLVVLADLVVKRSKESTPAYHLLFVYFFDNIL